MFMAAWPLMVNSFTPGRCSSNFKSIIFKLIKQKSSFGKCCEIALEVNVTKPRQREWLVAWRQQAIAWVNFDLDLCPRMASLARNELWKQKFPCVIPVWPNLIICQGKMCCCFFTPAPCNNSSPIQARITQFGAELQNNLIKIPIVLGSDPQTTSWSWLSQSQTPAYILI